MTFHPALTPLAIDPVPHPAGTDPAILRFIRVSDAQFQALVDALILARRLN